LDFTGLSLKDATDPSFNQNFSTGINPNLGWGLRFAKKNDAIYVGISQPRMIWNNFGIYEGAHKDVTMLYTMVGGNYKINDLISINPNALIRLAADLPNSWEVNVTANLMQLVDFGVGYRSMNSFSTNLGVNFNSKIYLGYLYEMPTTEMSQVSNQTHEIVLRYRLIKDNSPQFYKRKKSFKEIIDVRKYFKRR
jgi:type IX secretion system PorP/SprF family membrane protein